MLNMPERQTEPQWLREPRAFDYGTQQWTAGHRALVLIAAQAAEELCLITGDGGAEYLTTIGITSDQRSEYMHTIRERMLDARFAALKG